MMVPRPLLLPCRDLPTGHPGDRDITVAAGQPWLRGKGIAAVAFLTVSEVTRSASAMPRRPPRCETVAVHV
jgi:hypothetical protein